MLLFAVLPLKRRCFGRLLERGEDGGRVTGGPRLVELDSQFAVFAEVSDVCEPPD